MSKPSENTASSKSIRKALESNRFALINGQQIELDGN